VKFEVPELAIAVAKERVRCQYNSTTFYGDKWEKSLQGVIGELHFARCFGLAYTWARAAQQYRGDGGIDFTVPLLTRAKPLTIDVKIARKPDYLFIKKQDIGRGAEVLVLLKYDDEKGPSFIGWDWRSVMKRMPIYHVKKFNTYNYARRAIDLLYMDELCELLAYRQIRVVE
jgi:hypothetical protein